MTREEVIEWFKMSPFMHPKHVPFLMAIKALENENALIDEVLEIIDNEDDYSEQLIRRGEVADLDEIFEHMREAVLALKGGEYENAGNDGCRWPSD